VKSPLGHHARTDIRVASDAAELRLAPTDLVAIGAVHGAVEKLVLPGEWTGRDLRVTLRGEYAKEKDARGTQQQP
jgi:hypothetical protein